MIVMKFGGTSVGTAESVRLVREAVMARIDRQPVVVVSAVSGVTNLLVEAAETRIDVKEELLSKHIAIINQLWRVSPQGLIDDMHQAIEQTFAASQKLHGSERSDRIISLGEQLSSRIISAFIGEIHPARPCSATELLVTSDRFGSAEVIDRPTAERVARFKKDVLGRGFTPVVTGFLGATEDGRTTTLGRGGSDYSAALLGYYLKADEVQIWTDVDGVFTTDPRSSKRARLVPEITYEEASELAAFGAKVLHPKTMRPAIHGHIPIRIANTFRPDAPSTRIVAETNRRCEVVAVAVKQSVVMVTIYAAEMLLGRGFLARISSVFAESDISIDIVSASETSVSVTLDNHEQLEAALKKLREFSDVTVNTNVGLVSLIGQSIARSPALLGKICRELSDTGIEIEMVSVGASGINISLVLASEQALLAATTLHDTCTGGSI